MSSSRPVSARISGSLRASAGDVIFGMEDGTVSIFGLVAGVAATTTDSKQVLLAGAAGAAAAAVSMGAGVFLDRSTQQAQQATADKALADRISVDPAQVESAISARLTSEGLGAEDTATVLAVLRSHPGDVLPVAEALQDPPADEAGTIGHASWMLVANLCAGLVPVLPFAFLPVGTARLWAIGLTFVLIILLGIGRSRVGHTRLIPTILSTLAIAAVAAGAGVLISWWLNGIG